MIPEVRSSGPRRVPAAKVTALSTAYAITPPCTNPNCWRSALRNGIRTSATPGSNRVSSAPINTVKSCAANAARAVATASSQPAFSSLMGTSHTIGGRGGEIDGLEMLGRGGGLRFGNRP